MPDVTNPRGDLRTPAFDSVRRESERIESLTRSGFQPLRLIHGGDGAPVGPGSQAAMEALSAQLREPKTLAMSADLPVGSRRSFSPDERQKRQVRGMESMCNRSFAPRKKCGNNSSCIA